MTQLATREVEDTLTGTPRGVAAELDRLDQAGQLIWFTPPKWRADGQCQVRLRFHVPVKTGREVQKRQGRLPARAASPAPVVARPLWQRRWPYVTSGVTVLLGGLVWAIVTIGGVIAVYGTTLLGAVVVVGGLLAVGRSSGSGHLCILPGCRH